MKELCMSRQKDEKKKTFCFQWAHRRNHRPTKILRELCQMWPTRIPHEKCPRKMHRGQMARRGSLGSIRDPPTTTRAVLSLRSRLKSRSRSHARRRAQSRLEQTWNASPRCSPIMESSRDSWVLSFNSLRTSHKTLGTVSEPWCLLFW